MAKTKIVLNPFDLASLDDAIEKLNLYKRKVDSKIDLFFQRLSEEGVKIAKDKIRTFDAIFTAEILNELHWENRGGVYFIVSDTNHSAYVEMGTGQIGAEHPYKGNIPVVYGQGKHIQYAEEDLLWGDWVIPQGSYFWFYFGKDQRWHVTQGMPSRPYMYETAQELEKEKTIRRIAKEVFDELA